MSNARLLTILSLTLLAVVALCAWMVHRYGPVGPLIGPWFVLALFVLSLIAGLASGLRPPDNNNPPPPTT